METTMEEVSTWMAEISGIATLLASML